jgi:hypothetical protein
MTTGRHRKGLVLDSLTPPAAKSGQPGQPRQPPARPGPWHRLEFTGLVIGLACGLVVALAALAIHGSPGPAPRASGPVTIGAQPHAAAGPDPAALDAQWTTYSDRATCADWAGGDGVSAVSLGSGQLAWFFADTYLGPAGPAIGFSDISGFVHNSVVVQTTTGRQSRFVTLTGGGACDASGRSTRAPSSVVGPPQAPGLGNERYWDEDGIKVGGTVVKFYNRYLPGSVPFVATGTVIAAYDAGRLAAAGRGPAYGAVATPRLIALPAYTPPDAGSPVVWGAALLRSGDTVYVYGTQTPNVGTPSSPVPQRQLYLARVPASQLTSFGAWRFYAGSGQWTTAQQDAAPLQPAGGTPGLGAGLTASSGFSVVQAGGRYWLIQADPVVGSNDIDAYPGAAPWGPFDPAAGIVLYRNPDVGLDAAHDYRIMYEARAEPALFAGRAGGQLQRQLAGGHRGLRAVVGVHQPGNPAPVCQRAAGGLRRPRPRDLRRRASRSLGLPADRAPGPAAVVRRVEVPGRLPAGARRHPRPGPAEIRRGDAQLAGCRPGPAVPGHGAGTGPETGYGPRRQRHRLRAAGRHLPGPGSTGESQAANRFRRAGVFCHSVTKASRATDPRTRTCYSFGK